MRRSSRAVLVMGLAVAVSVATGGAASAAAGVAAVEKAPAAASASTAKPDKGPGPKGPKGAPYPKQASKLAAAAKAKQSGPTADAKGVEVPGMRTATSRMLEDPVTGLLSTQLAGESINYRDGKGAWQPVANTLKPAKAKAGKGAGWTNAANRFTATFPTTLAGGDPGAVSVTPARCR